MLRDISLEEAQRQINSLVSTLGNEELPLEELMGRVLARGLCCSPGPACFHSRQLMVLLWVIQHLRPALT